MIASHLSDDEGAVVDAMEISAAVGWQTERVLIGWCENDILIGWYEYDILIGWYEYDIQSMMHDQ